MSRTEERLERSRGRKIDRMVGNTHTVAHGPSIIEMLGTQLDKAAARYLDAMRNGTQKEVLIARGEVRGLARALSLMQNPYYPTRGIKDLETSAVQRARESRNAEAEDTQADGE